MEGMEALGAALAIGFGALGGAIGCGVMMGRAFTSIAQQPKSIGKLRPLIFVGIAFREAMVLYALIIALILLSGENPNAAEAGSPAGAGTPTAVTATADPSGGDAAVTDPQ
jgi:F-type H+-transporting ATPase subunit c